jgi:hypothetical protein
LTEGEVKYYREQLDKIISKQDEQLSLPSLAQDSPKQHILSSGKFLGNILEVFDKEVQLLEKQGRPTGLPLVKIINASLEEGDFAAATEGLLSLIRLAHLQREKGLTSVVSSQRWDGELTNKLAIQKLKNIPEANPTTSAIKVLIAFSQLDASLFRTAINRASRFSFIGDNTFTHFSKRAELPHSSFGVVHTIFHAICKELISSDTKWVVWEIIRVAVTSLVGLGFVLKSRGIEIPQPPTVMRVSLSGERWLNENDSKELLPFVSLVNSLASLPIDLFKYALETINGSLISFRVSLNVQDGMVLEDALESLKRFAVTPGSGIVFLSLKTPEDVTTFNGELVEINQTVRAINADIINYLTREHSLIEEGKIAV